MRKLVGGAAKDNKKCCCGNDNYDCQDVEEVFMPYYPFNHNIPPPPRTSLCGCRSTFRNKQNCLP